MSYCRFSSNNFWCDVYVYEDVCGGWTAHVAGYRHAIRPIPQIPWKWLPTLGDYNLKTHRMVYPNRFIAALDRVVSGIRVASYRLHYWSVGVIPRRPIGLPHDGARFNDETPRACAQRLIELRAMGYKVPQSAIDALLEEDELT